MTYLVYCCSMRWHEKVQDQVLLLLGTVVGLDCLHYHHLGYCCPTTMLQKALPFHLTVLRSWTNETSEKEEEKALEKSSHCSVFRLTNKWREKRERESNWRIRVFSSNDSESRVGNTSFKDTCKIPNTCNFMGSFEYEQQGGCSILCGSTLQFPKCFDSHCIEYLNSVTAWLDIRCTIYPIIQVCRHTT